MAEFYAQASERGPDSMPFTTWIIKGMLKDVPFDSQHSSDSMDVDDEGSAPALVKETLLLVADDKVQGEWAVLGPQWKLAYPPLSTMQKPSGDSKELTPRRCTLLVLDWLPRLTLHTRLRPSLNSQPFTTICARPRSMSKSGRARRAVLSSAQFEQQCHGRRLER